MRWIAVALFFGTLLIFARGIRHDFVNYDDPDYVTSNAHVLAGLNADTVAWAMKSGEASNWHPLTWMSHLLDVSLFGLNPHGHHATSVVWHALNAVLAFLALRRLTGAVWTSALCAALFAWHPLRVESVAWVSERKDVLSGFFGLLVLWLYAVYAERRRAGPGRGAAMIYAGMLVAFALGLMAKPMLVTLPCVLLLLDFWPLRRVAGVVVQPAVAGGNVGEAKAAGSKEVEPKVAESVGAGTKTESVGWLILEKLPFFALVVGSAWVTYLVQRGGGSVSSALTLGERVGNAVVSVVRYVGKFFFPVNLSVLYPHPGHWPAGTVVGALVLVAGVTALAVGQWRRRPWATVGWLWFAGMLVPVIGIVQVGLQAMADRYTYLPMLGVEMAVLWTVREWVTTPAARIFATWMAGAVLAICALATVRLLGVWENSGTLFTHAIESTANNYVAHDNRGLFLFKAGRVEEAMADYREALAINSSYLQVNNNLGHALSETGKPAEAVPLFRVALKAQPDHLEVHNNLANALSDIGELKEAMEHYDFVLARKPNHVNALNGSAVLMAMQGNPTAAKARLEQSLRIDPNNASAHNNLGNVCSMLEQKDEALAHYRRALELKPDDAHTLYVVGALLNEQGKYAEAVEVLRRSVAVRGIQPDALAQLGLALVQTGRRDEGVKALRAALQVQPGHAQAAAWLKAVEGK